MTRRPALTDAQKEQIRYLRGTRGCSHAFIAESLDRAVGSITWFCLQEGIDKPTARPIKLGQHKSVCQRGNYIVRRFDEQEDRTLVAMRLDGKTTTEIARTLNRRQNSIIGRLMTLARREARGTQ
jgi:IS30 family transposase